MIASWWLVFRASTLRWAVPVGSCLCLLLVSSNLRGSATSMQASSEAALLILIWAPGALPVVYASVRSSGLRASDDVLVLPLSPASRGRRSLSVLAAQLAWVVLGWTGFWAGCSVLASRTGTPLYWSMALNGIAMATLTSLVGALLAIHRRPAWLAAVASGAAYVGLALWFYLPVVPGSTLYSPYAPLFFTEAVPSSGLLLLQLGWAGAAALVVVGWAARALGTPAALVTALVSAAVFAALSSSVPEVRPRAGTVSLDCEPHRSIQVCLWADHEATRSRIFTEVDLAADLIGPGIRARYVSEGDLTGLPTTLPGPASTANTILISTSANPAPREAAARIVAAELRPPASCANLTAGSEFGPPVGAAVQRIVVDRRTSTASVPLSDRQLATRLAAIRRDITVCRRPVFP